MFAPALAFGLAAAAQAPDLALPIDCTPGEDCFIQQYRDHDAGPGAQDYRCGPMSYDGHKGTDFALPTRRAMQAGVAVLAAAPGEVRAARDEMPDIPRGAPDAPELAGRDCGNGLVIDHGGGWETQYCHLQRGSLRVAPGERVARGARLGLVGLSGRTDFAHLHMSLRHNGDEVDPFAPSGPACTAPPAETLWIDPPDYRPGGLVGIGIADHMPDFDAIRVGLPDSTRLPPRADALVVWGHAYGGRPGDVVEITVTGPAGTIVSHRATLDTRRARFFRAAGRALADRPRWPAGRYHATVTLERADAALDHETLAFTVPES
ncbi:peptidase M24 [Rhodobacteraceae bacterium WD3A24]|nr:peptidase M24 [Rhodobacteraceae bacterium WD3A24]